MAYHHGSKLGRPQGPSRPAVQQRRLTDRKLRANSQSTQRPEKTLKTLISESGARPMPRKGQNLVLQGAKGQFKASKRAQPGSSDLNMAQEPSKSQAVGTAVPTVWP